MIPSVANLSHGGPAWKLQAGAGAGKSIYRSVDEPVLAVFLIHAYGASGAVTLPIAVTLSMAIDNESPYLKPMMCAAGLLKAAP